MYSVLTLITAVMFSNMAIADDDFSVFPETTNVFTHLMTCDRASGTVQGEDSPAPLSFELYPPFFTGTDGVNRWLATVKYDGTVFGGQWNTKILATVGVATDAQDGGLTILLGNETLNVPSEIKSSQRKNKMNVTMDRRDAHGVVTKILFKCKLDY